MHFLNEQGAGVRNHMSIIEDEHVELARGKYRPGAAAPTAPVKAATAGEPVKITPETTGQPATQTPPESVAALPRPKPAQPVARHTPEELTRSFRDREPARRPISAVGPGQGVPRTADRPTGAPSFGVNRAPGGRPIGGPPPPRRGPAPAAAGQRPPAGRGGGQRGGGARGGQRGGQNRFREQPIRNQRRPMRPAVPLGSETKVKSVLLPPAMIIKNFAQLIEVAAGDVIKKLMALGMLSTINQEIDLDTMILLADEYKITAAAAPTAEEKVQVEEIEDDPDSLIHRSPVVTIMGHVDHGKTSLLDAIRETNVIASEAGGITQHIGAYQVELNDRKITFLDTPGHAAFTAMRARGAQVTDIAILVVAADDGVMPQTIEAINHAKDANVPIIVAVNKIDKPGAEPDRVKQQLTEYGLVAEEWGGETVFVPVSAKQRTGIEHLLEMILLVADVKDFKANPDRLAKGTVIEAQLDKGRGPVATVLIQTGTLHLGDSIIAGAAAGRVKVLNNDKGKRVKKAGPSMPVEVIGFNEVPEAGDIMYVVSEDRLARELADKRLQLKRESELKKSQKITLDDLFSKIKEGEIKDVKVIIKTDVQGSAEAIRQSLEQLTTDEVRVRVIHSGVGGIGEGDVMLASASNAIIIGFNVRPTPLAKRIAERESIDVRLYRVIYNIIEDVQKAMEGMLAPEFKELIVGRAEIRQVYKVPKAGNVAGCYVTEGKIGRNNEIRLIRDSIVIHEGKIDSLKRFKDDAKEVAEGFECGVGIEKFNDIHEGDIIEAFIMEEIKRSLNK
jgi:translation initiation factor IF-2